MNKTNCSNPSVNKLTSPLKKGRSLKTVLVGGCFDVLHVGHIIFLERAKKLGDKLVVLLESDENIRKNKGQNRPINNQKNRTKVLLSLKMVDKVIKLPVMEKDDDYIKVIKKIKPAIIAVSTSDEKLETKKREAKMVGAKLVEVTGLIPSQSTSRVVEIITQSL